MNISQFFRHWSIVENPFRGEEARNDAVFQRVAFAAGDKPDVGAKAADDVTLGSVHSDFEKILGELTRPSTSIVFGEKGSGKTAIRLQIEDRIRAHNARRPGEKVLVVPYDELNPFVSELQERFGGGKDELAPFKKARLVDHIDAILSIAVDRLTAGLFKEAPDREAIDLGSEPVKTARKLPLPLRRELLALHAVYDPADLTGERTSRMRRLLRLPPDRGEAVWKALSVAGWIPALAALILALAVTAGGLRTFLLVLFGVFLAGYAAVLIKRFAVDKLRTRALAGRLHREMRMLPRPLAGLAGSVSMLDAGQRAETALPAHEGADEPRYHMLAALRRILGRFGYTGMLVVIDRVDEPSAINGDAEKMRALMWPLLNNKFLQQEGFGVKMLLPIELRHALFRESAQFFQEARLDKQGLIERLTWTGPMLYDLCNARLQACREPGAESISLADLFDEDVSRADVVEALDQMQHPRDAFKLLYHTLNEHCASVTADEGAWKVPKSVLDAVRRAEAERVQGFYRGIRPA